MPSTGFEADLGHPLGSSRLSPSGGVEASIFVAHSRLLKAFVGKSLDRCSLLAVPCLLFVDCRPDSNDFLSIASLSFRSLPLFLFGLGSFRGLQQVLAHPHLHSVQVERVLRTVMMPDSIESGNCLVPSFGKVFIFFLRLSSSACAIRWFPDSLVRRMDRARRTRPICLARSEVDAETIECVQISASQPSTASLSFSWSHDESKPVR